MGSRRRDRILRTKHRRNCVFAFQSPDKIEPWRCDELLISQAEAKIDMDVAW